MCIILGRRLTYPTDRKMVEALYPIAVFHQLSGHFDDKTAHHLFEGSYQAVLDGCPDAAKISRRVRRLLNVTMASWEGRSVVTMFGVWTHWVMEMMERGTFDLDEENRFGRGHALFLEHMNEFEKAQRVMDQTEHVMIKQGAKLLPLLQKEGYYR